MSAASVKQASTLDTAHSTTWQLPITPSSTRSTSVFTSTRTRWQLSCAVAFQTASSCTLVTRRRRCRSSCGHIRTTAATSFTSTAGTRTRQRWRTFSTWPQWPTSTPATSSCSMTTRRWRRFRDRSAGRGKTCAAGDMSANYCDVRSKTNSFNVVSS